MLNKEREREKSNSNLCLNGRHKIRNNKNMNFSLLYKNRN